MKVRCFVLLSIYIRSLREGGRECSSQHGAEKDRSYVPICSETELIKVGKQEITAL